MTGKNLDHIYAPFVANSENKVLHKLCFQYMKAFFYFLNWKHLNPCQFKYVISTLGLLKFF